MRISISSSKHVWVRLFAVTVVVIAALWVDVMGSGGNANSFTDPRDGKTYRMVEMPDGMIWMAENLNFVIDDGARSWCYGNDSANCEKYGRLYTWAAAREACPAGWRLPTLDDWRGLVNAAGGNVAGRKLKASAPDWDGTDNFGFSALPGGNRSPGGSFDDVGSGGDWWSATEDDVGNAYYRSMYAGGANVLESWFGKGLGFSVRCIRN